jgi:hypothetical protein
MQIWGLNGPNGPAHGPPRKPMGRPNWAGYSNFGPWAGPCTGLGKTSDSNQKEGESTNNIYK